MSISCTQAATLIAVYANISFANITGIGWGWAGVIWLYSLIFYIPLDIIKFIFHYAMSGVAWNLVLDRKVGSCFSSTESSASFFSLRLKMRRLIFVLQTAFTYKKDYGKDDGTANVTISQRSRSAEEISGSHSRASWIAEQTRRRAEIARFSLSIPFTQTTRTSVIH